ncbi:MAG: HEAT repeat domain-containing protein [Actinomycetota bacterium]
MSEGDERARAAVALLRQLWLGLSAYRLYPGSVDRPGFVAAFARIDAAAREALASGPVDVEIRGDRLLFEGAMLPADEHLTRLGLACFERRVERLVVSAVPDANDLDQLYSVLTRTPDDLTASGGAGEVLRATGVTSVALSWIGPSAVEGADHVPEELEAVAEHRTLDADVLASELMVEDLRGDPSDQAATLLARLRSIIEGTPVEAGRAIDLHAAVHDVVTELPPSIRRSLVEILVDHVRDDPLAERLIGTMSNAELTRALVDLGRDGRRDPVELARQLAAAGARHIDIVDLTKALEAGHEEAGTIITGLEQLGLELGGQAAPPISGSVTEILSEYLSATEPDDSRAIRSTVSATVEQAHAVALLALGDYFSLEADLDRAGEVLEIWAEEARRALLDRNPRAVEALLQPIRESLPAEDPERGSLMEASVREVLDPDLVAALASSELGESASEVSDLLAPFGDLGVEVLLDLLAEEDDRNRRAMLMSVLRRMVPHHLAPVTARLDDPRWFVVRNAVTLLGTGGGPEVLERLAQAASHESAVVRREVASALVAAGGAAAIPFLKQLSLEGDDEVRRLAVGALGALVGREAAEVLAEVARTVLDRALRIRALEELAERPEGPDLLRELASSKSSPRLPWGLRRKAKALARERGRSQR